MSFLSSLDIVGSALTAERTRMDIISQNIANANTTVTSTGEPYRRQQVVYEEVPLTFSETLQNVTGGVEIAQIVESDRDFQRVYDPTHPQADEEGYVLYPNVDETEEQIDLLAASNAYTANLTVLDVLKATITKTLEMNK